MHHWHVSFTYMTKYKYHLMTCVLRLYLCFGTTDIDHRNFRELHIIGGSLWMLSVLLVRVSGTNPGLILGICSVIAHCTVCSLSSLITHDISYLYSLVIPILWNFSKLLALVCAVNDRFHEARKALPASALPVMKTTMCNSVLCLKLST